MPERRHSLRRRLLAVLLGAAGTIWLGVAATTFLDARREANALFDAQLTEYSEVLASIAGHEVFEIEGETTKLEHEYEGTLSYQVWALDGRLLMRSHAAPETPLAAHDGFAFAEALGKRVRVFRRTDEARAFVIMVAQDAQRRGAVVQHLAVQLLAPALVGLPLLAAAIWLAVARALAPLERLAHDVRGRKPGHLQAVERADAPAEVRPLVDALNQLFARVEASFERERRFTGDAAHELRTPLAALRTQAEVALSTPSEERRVHALRQVVAGVDRATRLVGQLLALARLDDPSRAPRACVDLAAVARAGAAEMAGAAAERGIALATRAEGPALVEGDAVMLHALARNLVDNAIRFAPPGGRVELAVERTGDELRLCVEDSGPGVPAAARERIFDRFFRASAEGEGSGLGLSIARRVVELHGGRIAAATSPGLGGLRIEAVFPAKESLRSAP